MCPGRPPHSHACFPSCVPLPPPTPHPPADSPGALVLTAPCVSTSAAPLPAYDRGVGRFTGNHYLKVCSPAWMHEWIMIEGLRR